MRALTNGSYEILWFLIRCPVAGIRQFSFKVAYFVAEGLGFITFTSIVSQSGITILVIVLNDRLETKDRGQRKGYFSMHYFKITIHRVNTFVLRLLVGFTRHAIFE